MSNLTALMERYLPLQTQDDLEQLYAQIANEDNIREKLLQDPIDKTADVLKFIELNRELIAEQHRQMCEGVAELTEKVNENLVLEAADAEYKAAVSSEPAVDVANKLADMNALSTKYRDFLKKNGRMAHAPILQKARKK